MNIKELRKSRKMTQEELAYRIGVHENTIRLWEKGIREPRLSDVAKLCEVLGCTESELLNGSDSQEFEVKIVMGVKSMMGLAGVEVLDNSFVYGVDDSKPQIVLAGKINVATPEDRKNALEEIIKKFHAACWMFDHKQEAEKGE